MCTSSARNGCRGRGQGRSLEVETSGGGELAELSFAGVRGEILLLLLLAGKSQGSGIRDHQKSERLPLARRRADPRIL